MKRLLLPGLICLFAGTAAFCQSTEQLVHSLSAKLKDYSANHITERAYLQFDKPYYAAGDTLYFKAYVVDGDQHKLSGISGILHVDLVSPGNRIQHSLRLPLRGGLAWGDFSLPDTLPKGNYRLHAYTQWMVDTKEGAFDAIVPIGALNTGVIYENGSPKQPFKADLQFFPESGSLVTDVRSKLAFKAIAADGLGTDIKGVIIDNNNHPVTAFSSTHLGMGVVSILPEEGKTYRAKVKFKDSVVRYFDLPVPLTRGAVLGVSTLNPEKVAVKININPNFYKENKDKTFLLTILSGEKLTKVDTKLDSYEMTLELPVNQFKTGISRFTLFAPSGEPVCERIAFVQNPDDKLNIAITSDKSTYNKREKVQLMLDAKAGILPAKGHYSVSVVDESKVPGGDTGKSIFADLLLTSELKGYVEDPDYYFSNTSDARADLDALMLTQGYRRFTWRELLNDRINYYKNAVAETGMTISGHVYHTSDQKPVQNGTVTLIASEGGLALSAQTDSLGRFSFNGLVYPDSTQFIVTATDKNGRKNTKVKIDQSPIIKDVPFTEIPVTAAPDMQAAIRNAREVEAQQALLIPANSKLLKEVQVKSYRSSNYGGSGHADQVILTKDIHGGGTMTDMLNGRLHGVTIYNGIPYLNLSLFDASIGRKGSGNGSDSSTGPTPMLLVIDGAAIKANQSYNLNSLNWEDVETVEVLKTANAAIYGINAGGGVLVITTKEKLDVPYDPTPARGMSSFKASGLYVARQFYSPVYDHTPKLSLNDLRSTVYWQPELTTDADGKATLTYYNADGTGNYRVVIEGIDDAGQPSKSVYRYTVK